MSARLQFVISAASIPMATFIALNRLAIGRPWWAALWAFVGVMHCWILVDTVRGIRTQRTKHANKENHNEST